MPVQLRFNANQIKSELSNILDRKIKKLYKDDKTQAKILELFYDECVEPQLKRFQDTGAFALALSGYPTHSYTERKTGKIINPTPYFRHGTKTISRGHGIERDAIEDRPKGPHHYFAYLACVVFDIDDPDKLNGQTIYENMWRGAREDFLEAVGEIVTEAMNNE